jgi:hypothetical protein
MDSTIIYRPRRRKVLPQYRKSHAVGVSVMLSEAKHLPGSWMGRPFASLRVTWAADAQATAPLLRYYVLPALLLACLALLAGYAEGTP